MVDVESALPPRVTRQSSLPTYEEAVSKYTTDSSSNINRFLTAPSAQNFTGVQNPPDVQGSINSTPYSSVYANTNYNQTVHANSQSSSGEVRSGNDVTGNFGSYRPNSGTYEVPSYEVSSKFA